MFRDVRDAVPYGNIGNIIFITYKYYTITVIIC